MSDSPSNNKRIAKNAVFLYLRLLFVLCISIYTTRVVLRTLGVVDYGVYNVVAGFVTMFSFINASLSNGIQRFYNFEFGKNGYEAVTKVYRTACLIQLSLAIIVLVLVETVGVWYINNKMVISDDRLFAAKFIFQFSVASLFLIILQVPYSAAIMAHEHMNYYALVGIIDAILKLGIVCILPFLTGDQLIAYGFLLFIVTAVDTCLYIVYAKRNFSELKFAFCVHKDLLSEIFAFSGWNVVETFAWMTQGQGVNMVLNLFGGPVVNAAQGIAAQIQNAVSGFCSNLVAAFRPQLVQSYAQEDYERTCKMMYVMSKAMFAMYYCMAVPIIIELDYILHIWIGDGYPEYTKSFTTLILLSIIPRNFSMGLSQVVHATGKMKTYQIMSACVILTVLPVSFLLLKMGLEPSYVYLANLVICILLWALNVALLRRIFVYSITDYLLRVIAPSCIIIIMLPILLLYITSLIEQSFIRLIVICVCSVVLTALLGLLFLLSKSEKRIIYNLLKKTLKK